MALSPMMTHYLKIKDKIGDTLLFYRVGDFYEMFFEDAKTVSQELELVLTGKDCGLQEKAPMCGVPHHAVKGYIGKLISRGYKIAICEQMENASEAKGLVRRDIVKIVTPGTFDDTNFIDDKSNNFIMCVFSEKGVSGVSFADITTGELYHTTIATNKMEFFDEITKFNPKEIIFQEDFDESIEKDIVEKFSIVITKKEKSFFESTDEENESFINLKLGDYAKASRLAVQGILRYVIETQKESLSNFTNIEYYSSKDYMQMNSNTRKNLEITQNIIDGGKKNTLLSVLDKTCTAMGGRRLRNWIEQPLVNIEKINERLEVVNCMYNNFTHLEDLRLSLKGVYDMERIAGKIASKNVNVKEMIILKNSIAQIPKVVTVLRKFQAVFTDELCDIDYLEDIYEIIDKSLEENPPMTIKDGNIIKIGYNKEIDELKNIKNSGKEWLSNLENRERQFTGIKNLKIGYNKVFGYYIEITKSNYAQIPEGRYVRKQTLTNAERFITEELKEMEDKILTADDKLINLEYELFLKIRTFVESNITRIQEVAKKLSIIDVYLSFSLIAKEQNYIRPKLNETGTIYIKDGRHPVIEKIQKRGNFISNNTILDIDENRIAIITGPNMAGKSTYMRQVAIITLMAQMGSFVPCESADISICDKIFTRIGASDDLSSGKSTFMVEMTEVSNILKNATSRSLIILDEVGRGTSTFDGLSIAFAVIEDLASENGINAKTLFATHYHELTQLEGVIDGVTNYNVSISEIGGELVFLRKIKRGGADKSYGIEVAKLAGLPENIIERAKKILISLEKESKNALIEIENLDIDFGKKINTKKKLKDNAQVVIGDVLSNSLIEKIKSIDISNMTPMESLMKLNEIIESAKRY